MQQYEEFIRKKEVHEKCMKYSAIKIVLSDFFVEIMIGKERYDYLWIVIKMISSSHGNA